MATILWPEQDACAANVARVMYDYVVADIPHTATVECHTIASFLETHRDLVANMIGAIQRGSRRGRGYTRAVERAKARALVAACTGHGSAPISLICRTNGSVNTVSVTENQRGTMVVFRAETDDTDPSSIDRLCADVARRVRITRRDMQEKVPLVHVPCGQLHGFTIREYDLRELKAAIGVATARVLWTHDPLTCECPVCSPVAYSSCLRCNEDHNDNAIGLDVYGLCSTCRCVAVQQGVCMSCYGILTPTGECVSDPLEFQRPRSLRDFELVASACVDAPMPASPLSPVAQLCPGCRRDTEILMCPDPPLCHLCCLKGLVRGLCQSCHCPVH